MQLYRYKATCTSPLDGRTFTLNIKSPVSHNLASLRKKIEERSKVTVSEISAVEVYPKPDIPDKDLIWNLHYAGVYYLSTSGGQIPIDVSRQIIPMYDLPFDSLNQSNWVDLEKYFQGIYGQTFKLVYAQLVQTN